MNMACIISGPMGPEPDAMKVARPVLLNRGITHFPLIYGATGFGLIFIYSRHLSRDPFLHALPIANSC
ncbi:MAG: hypothetical protein ACTSUE_03825, partial [Promethearchaeota archaeon]